MTISAVFSMLAVATASPPVVASDPQLGSISKVSAASSGAVLFNTSGTRKDQPTCQNKSLANRFAVDASRQAGQAQLQLLLEALRQGKQIVVQGTRACSIVSDVETVETLDIEF
jgi:hypothetical protein